MRPFCTIDMLDFQDEFRSRVYLIYLNVNQLVLEDIPAVEKRDIAVYKTRKDNVYAKYIELITFE